MTLPILSVLIRYENDTVAARQRARQIARFLGFDAQDQTRIATAVSEIARNAFNYAGGGRIEYQLEGRTSPQLLMVKVTDSGPGIRDLNSILDGHYQSQTGMGLGIIGARRLMDRFQIDSQAGIGTSVLMKKVVAQTGAVCSSVRSRQARVGNRRRKATGCVSGTAASESRVSGGSRRNPHPPDRTHAFEPGTGRYEPRRSCAVRRAG
jgi:anti-sigma regulatory factor (Ser/Thr protein kinase)